MSAKSPIALSHISMGAVIILFQQFRRKEYAERFSNGTFLIKAILEFIRVFPYDLAAQLVHLM